MVIDTSSQSVFSIGKHSPCGFCRLPSAAHPVIWPALHRCESHLLLTHALIWQYRIIGQERFARKFCIRMRCVSAAIQGVLQGNETISGGQNFCKTPQIQLCGIALSYIGNVTGYPVRIYFRYLCSISMSQAS